MKTVYIHSILFILFNIFLTHVSYAEINNFHLAAGGGASFYIRQDYGEAKFTQFAPEIVAYGYLPIINRFWFRPGMRVNYSWQQPDMPQALRIEETDLRYLAEVGLTYDWIVIPSLSFGIGQIYRSTKLKTSYPVTSKRDEVSGSEFIPFSQVQIGLGIPILRGLILVEPYARYTTVQNDSRFAWSYGTEVTFEIL